MLQRQSGVSLVSACKALHLAITESLAAACGLSAPSQQFLPLAAAAGTTLQQQRCKHTVRMVLLQKHDKLGERGDIVKVKAGYARYTLFPQGIADYAIPSVLRDLKGRGLLSAEALLQLQGGARQQGAAARVDPALLPLEQQLQKIIKLLHKQPLVVSRQCNRRQADEPMLGQVTKEHLAACAAKQLRIALPSSIIKMSRQTPITSFGTYKVPLDLKDANGQQVELEVLVQKTYRSPGIRSKNLQAKQLFAHAQQKSL